MINVHTPLCTSYHIKWLRSPSFFISLLYFTNPKYRWILIISLGSTRDSFYCNNQWMPCNIGSSTHKLSSCIHINYEYKFRIENGTSILSPEWYDHIHSLTTSWNKFYDCKIFSTLLFTLQECKIHIFHLMYAYQQLHFL